MKYLWGASAIGILAGFFVFEGSLIWAWGCMYGFLCGNAIGIIEGKQ